MAIRSSYYHVGAFFAAEYLDRDGNWRAALNALGQTIRCETHELALSVARYRRRRLQIWR